MSSSRRVSGFQSGHDTQFLFSEGDVRDSEADAPALQPAAGEFSSLHPLSFCE